MTIKDIVAIALFAALIAALGFIPAIPVPVIPVPITAQSLGIMLAGAFLGAKRGFCAVLVFLILVAVGLPLLSGGRGGLGVFVAPSAGYMLGFLLGVAVIGFLYETFADSLTPTKEVVFLVLGGIVVVHLFGVLWLAYISDISVGKAFIADLMFLPGDGVKVALAYGILRIIRKALPGLFATR